MSTASSGRSLRHSTSPAANPAGDAELRDQIASHLRERGLASLEVAVSGGAVTLSGRVSSPYERQMAVMTVRRIAGVEKLSDQIRIVPVQAPRVSAARRAADFGTDVLGALSGWFAGTPKLAWVVVVAAAVIVPISMTSCGKSEARVSVYPVKGKVTFNGEAPQGANVSLQPVGHSLPPGVSPRATVQKDGTFEISVYSAADGAPPGEYAVTLQWPKVVAGAGGAGPGPNVLPKEYAKVETTPVKVTVKNEPVEIPTVEITTK